MRSRKARSLKQLAVIRVTMICKLDLMVYEDNDAWSRITETDRQQPNMVQIWSSGFMAFICSVKRHDDAAHECGIKGSAGPEQRRWVPKVRLTMVCLYASRSQSLTALERSSTRPFNINETTCTQAEPITTPEDLIDT